VVLEKEAGGFGGFAQTAGDAAVGFARCGIAGGVIVDEDEGVGVVDEYLSQQIARMGDAFVQAAFEGLFAAHDSQLGVNQDDANGFVTEGLHFRSDVLVDSLRAVEYDLCMRRLLCGAAAKLESSGEQGGFRRPQGFDLSQHRRFEAGEIAEGFVIPQDALADLQGVFTFRAGVDEEGEEFGIGESLRTEAKQS